MIRLRRRAGSGICALAAFAVLGLAGGIFAAPAAAVGGIGTLQLSTTSLVPGQAVTISGAGWTPNSPLQASLCGNSAIDGSVDCAVTSSLTFSAGPQGAISGALPVTIPPKPCPCVVLVLGVQDEYSHSFPVTVAGTSVTNGSQSPSNPVTVSARVEGGSTFASLLGASADRTLLVTVHNAGRDTVQSLITARWGKSSAPDGVITSPNFITVSAGQTKRVSIPFKLSPLSYGTYHVVGELSGLPATDTFTATTTTWPWGLPVVLLLIVVAIVLFAWYRRRVRARERIAVDSFGPGQAAPGLAALAAMSSVLADDDGGALRLEQVLLLGDIDGEATAVPVAELTLDSRGVGVTNPSTNELRILTWASIRGVHVLDRLDVEDAPDFISSLGSVIDIETTHSTYRFVAPDVSPKDLTQQVDRVVRLWIRPPVRVPSLATGN